MVDTVYTVLSNDWDGGCSGRSAGFLKLVPRVMAPSCQTLGL
jgi:hypothetical protein